MNMAGVTKKVAIIFRLDQPGGVQSCIFSLVRGLNAQNIVPDILWDQEPDWELLGEEGVKVNYREINFTVPTKIIDRLPNSFRYLAWICNAKHDAKLRKDYDFFYVFRNNFIVAPETPHLYYLSGPPLLPQLEMTPKGIRGVPIRIFRLLYKAGLRNVAPVYDYHRGCNYVINSQYTSDMFEEAHRVKLPVVYPPIKISSPKFSVDEFQDRDTITFFSRIVDYKRPEFVLKLAQRYPKMRCVIMGAVTPNRVDYFQSLQLSSEKEGLSNVTFLSNPSYQKVREELARTKFYVFPAINEHFGMTTPEAISQGAIPFVHDSGGQREIVNNPLFRFDDAEFIEKFDALYHLNDDELEAARISFVKHVRTFSEEVFISKMVEQLLKLT